MPAARSNQKVWVNAATSLVTNASVVIDESFQ
jgi:hypothetical protein